MRSSASFADANVVVDTTAGVAGSADSADDAMLDAVGILFVSRVLGPNTRRPAPSRAPTVLVAVCA
jgi:hypothetical protein